MKCYLLSTYYTVDYKKISDKEINKIINKEYLDKRYSERIKKNKQDVYDDINALINQFLDGKIDINTIYSEVEKKYSLNAYMSKRLVESEITRIQSDINDRFAEENGIEYQMYMATLDEHTCHKCAKDDGEVFRVDDTTTNLNYLDTHSIDVVMLIYPIEIINLSQEWIIRVRK